MRGADLFSETVTEEPDPRTLEPYHWCSGTYFHDFVRPRHHLSIQAGGDAEIYVRMIWGSSPTGHELHRNCSLQLNNDKLQIITSNITFDHKESGHFKDFSKHSQNAVIDADRIFGLSDILADQREMLWTHFALSAVEKWRRHEESLRAAEAALKASNSEVVYFGRTLNSMLKHTHSEYVELERERSGYVREEYISKKETAEKLCSHTNDWQAAAQTAKAKAVEAVIECGSRFPNSPLPIELADAVSMRNAGIRLGL